MGRDDLALETLPGSSDADSSRSPRSTTYELTLSTARFSVRLDRLDCVQSVVCAGWERGRTGPPLTSRTIYTFIVELSKTKNPKDLCISLKVTGLGTLRVATQQVMSSVVATHE